MKKYLVFLSMFLFSVANAQQPLQKKPVPVLLSNGWSLTPIGNSLPLGDLPLNIAVSSSKKYIAITNNGQSTQSIQLIDAVNKKILSTVEIPKSWLGLKFSSDEKMLYASGGNDNAILQYAIKNNKLNLQNTIQLGDAWPNRISPTGIEIDDAKKIMYVVTKDNFMLYRINLATRKIIDSLNLYAEAYTCILSPDKKQLYISLWGGDKLMVYNTQTNKTVQNISVGDNPL